MEERRTAERDRTAQVRQQREEELKQQRERAAQLRERTEGRQRQERVSDEDRRKAIESARQGRVSDESVERLRRSTDKDALRETLTELRRGDSSREDIRRNWAESRRDRDIGSELTSMQRDRQAGLVGADLSRAVRDRDGGRDRRVDGLSREDALRRLGDAKARPRVELTESQLNALRGGRLPDGVARPREDYRLGRPLRDEMRVWGRHYDRDWRGGRDRWDDRWGRDDFWRRFDDRRDNIFNISINIGGAFLPPVVSPGYYPDYASFSWNYWDGRRRYDHSYATSVFLNLGHVRYGGFDGVVVSGRYYSYGYGWINGCIDYGGCRIWVPGIWAPYTVRECTNIPVWIEPVYETIWTGCCWETVQVDGGYFRDYGYTDCRDVTRYQWVPGHFQYSYCM